jgi:hypothetical protein
MEKELKHITEVVLSIITARDFENLLLNHISPDFSGPIKNHPYTLSLADLISKWRDESLEHPQLRLRIIDTDVQVQQAHRTALVAFVLAVCGMGDVRSLGLWQFGWKFTNGKWLWCAHSASRGVCEEGRKVCPLRGLVEARS